MQADKGPLWTECCVGRSLRGLHSESRVVRPCTLRQLHVRFWHAPAKRLRDLLPAAGAPQAAINEVQHVVDTCRVCREWQRLSAKPVTSLTLTSRFNEGVQFDVLFLDDCVCAHMICLCTRWAQAQIVESREPGHALPAFDLMWMRQYSPPKFTVSDQEGASFSDEGATWASR